MTKYFLQFDKFEQIIEKNCNQDEKFFISGCASALNLVDSYHDCITPGAFDKFLNKERIKMRYNHDYDVEGEWVEIVVDKQRNELWVKGFLKKNDQNSWLISKIVSGELKGLSIGCYLRNFLVKNNVRYLLEVELVEISLVFLPANTWTILKPYYYDIEKQYS